MSENTPVQPNSLGVFDESDYADSRRRIVRAMVDQGADFKAAARAANISIGEARRFCREYAAELEAKRKRDISRR